MSKAGHAAPTIASIRRSSSLLSEVCAPGMTALMPCTPGADSQLSADTVEKVAVAGGLKS